MMATLFASTFIVFSHVRIDQCLVWSHPAAQTFRFLLLNSGGIFHGCLPARKIKTSQAILSRPLMAQSIRRFSNGLEPIDDDPKYAHLQWTEITEPSRTRAFIDMHARAGG
ncbi:hypothetical protein [Burkholderia pyrrocinia]|uniref:hypothetical protein n=1 Tax=Burkholderia pyrrocinia TaxID=60550 RepID=UPI0020C68A41|nr:hypothetical protein [Burkholderia pyrrocinia]